MILAAVTGCGRRTNNATSRAVNSADANISLDQDDPRVRAESERLVGSWSIVAYLVNNKGSRAESGETCEFTTESLRATHASGISLELPYKLIPVTTPKQIDWGQADDMMRGIYEISESGLVVKWYFNEPGQPRPSVISTMDSSDAKYLIAITRLTQLEIDDRLGAKDESALNIKSD
jgi:uncharacterized protein (TIGR03067 family)